MAGLANHLVIDDFLSPGLHERLLDHVLSPNVEFEKTQCRGDGQAAVKQDIRDSWSVKDGLGPFKAEFTKTIAELAGAIMDGTRTPRFDIDKIETELVVHRDGNFFLKHIDTLTDDNRFPGSDRIVSMIYYFHAQPRGFEGGELALHPFRPDGEPELIEAKDNRLVAFPSFAPHEVLPVRCPGDDIRSSRFSVNCWLRRAPAR